MASTVFYRLTEDIMSLEYVIDNILTIRKVDSIRNVTQEQLNRIPEEERTFISKWRSYVDYPGICSLQMPNNQTIRFLVNEAYVETSKYRRNMFENDELLPKAQRTIYETVKTVFFERNRRSYVAIFTTSQTSLNKIKHKLFEDETYIDTLDNDYLIDGDMFYWLFYKYEEKNKLISERFEVEAISGFLGNIADETHVIRGESEVIPTLLVTKAFVSKFHPIRSLNVMLKLEDYRLSFIFNDLCQCSISTSCRIPNSRYDVEVASTIVIYAFILPYLSHLFETDEEWSSDAKTSFARRIGEEVIKEIADFHGIDLKTLE